MWGDGLIRLPQIGEGGFVSGSFRAAPAAFLAKAPSPRELAAFRLTEGVKAPSEDG